MLIEKRLQYGECHRKGSPPEYWECWIRIYDLVGDYTDPQKVRMVVYCELSEIADYKGLSVTNGAEHIATALWHKMLIHPDRTIYVEHYPDRRPAEVRESPYASTSRLDGAESFDICVFEWRNGEASNPKWKASSRQWVEAVIGERFADLSP